MRCEPLAKALEAHTEPINNPFGVIGAGFLKISGSLCCVQQFPIGNTNFTQRC